MAGASRTELLAWLNELLQINYTKVEQYGAGGAYLQVLDSIYLDVPMGRVKMGAKQEYEYVANYKIMQNIFKAKKIDKPIPMEKLIKCKMQDNLEFLQWLKKFWDANYSGESYDAIGRRKGAPAEPPATLAPARATVAGSTGAGAADARMGGRTPVGGHRAEGGGGPGAVLALTGQVRELGAQVEELEKERGFHFRKVRPTLRVSRAAADHTHRASVAASVHRTSRADVPSGSPPSCARGSSGPVRVAPSLALPVDRADARRESELLPLHSLPFLSHPIRKNLLSKFTSNLGKFGFYLPKWSNSG
ncbi:calponin homology domain-containing protein [Mycena latifolia]|nr:calponin homology domain-containing protein [Mycena latifolia]